jgi:hypothetical protein
MDAALSSGRPIGPFPGEVDGLRSIVYRPLFRTGAAGGRPAALPRPELNTIRGQISLMY